MYLQHATVVTSASDLTTASKCEFAFLRALDAKLGRIDPVPDPEDAMLERSGRLGDKHEAQVLERYRAEFGDGVVEIPRPDLRDGDAVAAAVQATLDAFASGADVVFQATFASEDFIGFADFIVRRPGGVWLVQDTKLARRARVTALLQLAAYAEQLERHGVPCADTVELLLGDGSVSVHRLADITPVYRLRRARLRELVDARVAADGPVEWGDPRYAIDGRCPTCALEVEAHRDVLLVAGMRVTQRARLMAAGIATIDDLAASTGPVDGVAAATLEGLRAQARLQLRAEHPAMDAVAPPAPPFEVRDPQAFAAIPDPDAGDLFFDFEGDPLYTEGDGSDWGLDYLFGMVDAAERFTPIWAHDFAEERLALERFLDFVMRRRAEHPGMHIYHYASYERTHLSTIAARHGVGEVEVDRLLREGVLVDLYPIVKRGVRVGSRSYSIKKLEPLYMGDEVRVSDVQAGGDSITEYVRARELMASTAAVDEDSGLPPADAAAELLADLADYNRYDCVSTLRLRDWLLGLARREGVHPAEPVPERDGEYAANPLAVALQRLAEGPAGTDEATAEMRLRGGQSGTLFAHGPRAAGPAVPPERTADQTALALAAAAIDYYPRERKSFWWAHYFRLEQPVEEWEDTRDVMVVDPMRSQLIAGWAVEGRRAPRRRLLLRGHLGPGTRFSEDRDVFLLYEPPGPGDTSPERPGYRVRAGAKILEVLDDGVIVEEQLSGETEWFELPMALTPGWPLNTAGLEAAIAEWGTHVHDAHPAWPMDAASDLLRRVPPRFAHGGTLAPVAGGDTVRALVDSLRRLDRSYTAVQGPPGTGKTFVASHVIARLVAEHRWRIGVVAQSHAVVENLLERVVDAGLSPELVAKAPKEPADQHFTIIAKNDLAAYTAEHRDTGYVVGGTTWDFTNPRRMGRGQLDLLVIDEAGQFSLASTIAASVAAERLLLLGDPQQLPQVSQGSHPEPVDRSALGWLADGHDVLPAEFGYFLPESRRMHPAVARPVSVLSYEGALHSHETAAMRELEGTAAGLHAIPVVHHGNATESPEEAAEVVRIVQELLGEPWHEIRERTDPATGEVAVVRLPPRPLAQRDIIVVTPYNAQMLCVREALDAAGLSGVPVGTVDKFQGQEAAIAVVSLAASSAREVPRGLDFLLMKNRLNVAVSRAKWAAFLVSSPGLLDALPYTPDGVAQLSAFTRLIGAEPPPPPPAA
ncbi:TM0106 family RecB-like putative nuclease [Agromyces archimandritae]|uniref:TM0106 family RecB-like putative nuclease n=1 Tax=Agromyces archimandritae TaxID=2781962 RepID=A0A975FNJ5_9MICO|nr:bifunctional RecB family nuclease/DEAD/DEAH box helicase [Agromyces archimandritae]QTX05700.1 TM0106 family RecB-like putative nuclease [Agromyces archimandritae]